MFCISSSLLEYSSIFKSEPILLKNLHISSIKLFSSTLNNTRWIGSKIIPSSCTLFISTKANLAGSFSCSSGLRVFFFSSQIAFAVAKEWFPSHIAKSKTHRFSVKPYFSLKLSELFNFFNPFIICIMVSSSLIFHHLI
jgi:hypothetical protein